MMNKEPLIWSIALLVLQVIGTETGVTILTQSTHPPGVLVPMRDVERCKEIERVVPGFMPVEIARIITSYDEVPPTLIPYFNPHDNSYARNGARYQNSIFCFTVPSQQRFMTKIELNQRTRDEHAIFCLEEAIPLEEAMRAYCCRFFPGVAAEEAYPTCFPWSHKHSGLAAPRGVDPALSGRMCLMACYLLNTCRVAAVLRTSAPSVQGSYNSLLCTAPGMSLRMFTRSLREIVEELARAQVQRSFKRPSCGFKNADFANSDESTAIFASDLNDLLSRYHAYMPVLEKIIADDTEQLVPVFYPRGLSLRQCLPVALPSPVSTIWWATVPLGPVDVFGLGKMRMFPQAMQLAAQGYAFRFSEA